MKYKNNGFTMMELLIVTSLIAILATTAIVLLNPAKQIQKSWDTKRKNDLSQLQKIFEDYYNDKQYYPKPGELCSDATTKIFDDTFICQICGLKTNPTNFAKFSPYLSRLPCDPQNSLSKHFLYHVNSVTNPTWYRIYTNLSNDSDPVIANIGCSPSKCGPISYKNYNFGVSSPNSALEH